jgi:ABC-type sugar transport system ATPase subunit
MVITQAVDGQIEGMSGRVALVEHMGAQNVFIVQAGKQQITCTAEADFYLPPGTNVTLQLNQNKPHFFDADTGQNLALPVS